MFVGCVRFNTFKPVKAKELAKTMKTHKANYLLTDLLATSGFREELQGPEHEKLNTKTHKSDKNTEQFVIDRPWTSSSPGFSGGASGTQK